MCTCNFFFIIIRYRKVMKNETQKSKELQNKKKSPKDEQEAPHGLDLENVRTTYYSGCVWFKHNTKLEAQSHCNCTRTNQIKYHDTKLTVLQTNIV